MPERQFEFIPGTGSFIPVLQQMLDYITSQCNGLPDDIIDTVNFSSKTILTELLTNAIKHSKSTSTLIAIKVDKHSIEIIKTDTGRPLALLQHPELATPGSRLIFSKDAFHVLLATAAPGQTIHFECTEIIPPGVPDIAALPEHFGFLMIAKITSAFYYQYQAGSGTNRFSAKIDIKGLS